MGFAWNGVHTSSIKLYAEARALPVLPEPMIITEELAGRDGFYDFTAYNADGRQHYRAREWEYRCAFEGALKTNAAGRVEAIARLFGDYAGHLIDDGCVTVRWEGVVANQINLTSVARAMHTFGVIIRTQPFGEGLTTVTYTRGVSGAGSVSLSNPGTWYVKPRIYLTGAASGMTINGKPIPYAGALINRPVDWLELRPGDNEWAVAGFSGEMKFEFTPIYVWG